MSTALLAHPPSTRQLPATGGHASPGLEGGFAGYQTPDIPVPQNLEDGAMVVMYSAPGELIIVRPNGKYWELEAISTMEEPEGKYHVSIRPPPPTADHEGESHCAVELTLQFFPSVSLFSVVRKGRYIGFKSLAADGRTLQAVTPDEGVPLRVNNHNFGAWESWEASGAGFVNKKWPQRSLALEVREIQAVAVEDLRRLERHNLKMSKDMKKQVRTLDIKLQETKKQLQEQSRSRKRVAMQHQRELDDARTRYEEAMRAKQRLEVDAVQTGARLKQKELQFQQLTLQRDKAEADLEQREANHRAHEREMELLKEKHTNEMDGLRRQHRNEVDALKRNGAHEMGRSTQRANGEVHILQQKLEQADQDKEREVRRVCMEYQHTIQQKISEIGSLRDENRKLTSALQTIREQLSDGFYAINSCEMPSSRAGTERSLELQSGGFNPFSPAQSRASSVRRTEDTTGGSQFQYERVGMPAESSITPRRGSVPCPPSPYGRRSPVHSPEPFTGRSSCEFRRPRRGDSRLSDNSGLGRVSDEIHPPFRRPGSGFVRGPRHHEQLNLRLASQLDSVEASPLKEDTGYEVDAPCDQQEAVGAADEKTEQTKAETDSDTDAESNTTPVETNETTDEAKEDTPRQSGGISVDTEESLTMEEKAVADPASALSSSDDSEASGSKSWMNEIAVPISQQLHSGVDGASDKDSKLDEE